MRRDSKRATGVRVARATLERFVERDLFSYASTIAFQVLYALVPLGLAGMALLGFLGLEEAWDEGIAPELQGEIDENLFAVVDNTVQSILGERRTAWLTFGLAFAVWQVSAAIRAASGPLNAIYHAGEERPMSQRLLVSLGVATATTPLLVLAAVSVGLGHRLIGLPDLGAVGQVVTGVVRWGLTAAALLVVVWLVLRYAPSKRRPWRWNSLGALLVVGGWTVASIGFAFYLQEFADYESLYGGFASIIVLLTYLYMMAVVFLGGVQVDEVLHDYADEGLETELPGMLRDQGAGGGEGGGTTAARPVTAHPSPGGADARSHASGG